MFLKHLLEKKNRDVSEFYFENLYETEHHLFLLFLRNFLGNPGNIQKFKPTHLVFFAQLTHEKTAEVLPSSQEVDVVQLTLQRSVVVSIFLYRLGCPPSQ